MFDAKKFTTPSAKPLPVVLLLDVSGSMSGEKIQSLNAAVREMLNSFAQEEKMETEILVSIITFGESVQQDVPYTKASKIEMHPMQAGGGTPMGTALQMAKAMIEDKEITPSRAYRPTVILVSDGQPTDSWEEPLENFISNGRSSKCDRMAMAIGHDANQEVLKRFIGDMPHELFLADSAGKLHEFFRRVTMSVTMRSKSRDPNQLQALPDPHTQNNKNLASPNKPKSAEGDEGYW